MSEPRTAVVIVSYRTGPSLFEAIESALVAEGVSEVIVVDNGNPTEVEAWLAAHAALEPRLRVLHGHGNVGFARGCNLGAAAAEAPSHLLFLNPDAAIRPDVVRALVEAGEVRRRPWIVGARIVGHDGREQRGARRRAPTLARAFGALLGGRADAMHLEEDALPASPIAVDAVSGAGLLMRADDYAALGGFDEAYFLHVEDLDLCRRAVEAGGEVVFVPSAEVRHIGQTSDAPAMFVEWCKGRGLARYLVRFSRGPEKLLAVLLGPAVVAAAVGRALLRSSSSGTRMHDR